MMISNPSFIFYTCIAKGTTIVAEFNSRDADLAALAAKCLQKTPPSHSTFSHTIRKRTYSFLIDDPFVYFAIHDEKLETAEGLCFLRSVKEAFDKIIIADNGKSLEKLSSRCFQGEFNPVFHQLLASPADMEVPHSPRGAPRHHRNGSLDSPRGKRTGLMPLLGGDKGKSLKKKKKRFGVETDGESRDGKGENGAEPSSDAIVLSRDFSGTMQKNGLFGSDLAHQKARRVWKKHVWVVLSLDLFVCIVLFVIWLWICRGFKCIDG